MRYGIFSDVHSNVEAFESVIDAFKKEKIDIYVSVGDIVGYGAEPSRAIEMTKRLTGNAVCGNHDRGSVGLLDISSFNPFAREAVLWTVKKLNAPEQVYLKALKTVYEDENITAVHGSLDEPEQFHYILDVNAASETFGLMKTRICFIGHSHSPAIFMKTGRKTKPLLTAGAKIEKGASYIVNVGSVGQPRDGDPRACYAIFDTAKNDIEIKRVPYDIGKAQDKILAAGLPPILAGRLSEGK
ncbi:MAG: metallophosphoesterase family protein [Candidatus Omnitrophica bacterium]|nr:metallophosphoesterase family protein [Candidatus Omnitrophota bacterium]